MGQIDGWMVNGNVACYACCPPFGEGLSEGLQMVGTET